MSGETPAYLEPLKAEMARVESEITDLEKRLGPLRATRTVLGRTLSMLDPQWAASNSNKSKSKSKSKSHPQGASPERVEQVTQWLRENKPSDTFTNQSLSVEIGLHDTTVARVTKQLHDEGVIRIDHMSGARRTQKNFRLVTDA